MRSAGVGPHRPHGGLYDALGGGFCALSFRDTDQSNVSSSSRLGKLEQVLELFYGDLLVGRRVPVQKIHRAVADADFDDDPSAPGVDYRNTAELEFSVPSDGVRTARAEVVHRYL